MIDPGEKKKLFSETITRNSQWLGVIARNNAPGDSWQDLQQEICFAFWKSLDSYDGKRSNIGTWLYSVAMNTAKEFKRDNHNSKKRDERIYPRQVFVEQDRDEMKVVEEFIRKLEELDRQIFTMYLDDLSYAEMSAATGISDVNLRKRVSYLKQQFKAKYV